MQPSNMMDKQSFAAAHLHHLLQADNTSSGPSVDNGTSGLQQTVTAAQVGAANERMNKLRMVCSHSTPA
jgi:hypothetical protein